MPRRPLTASVLVVMLAAAAGPGAQQGPYRTLDDTFSPPPQRSMEEWKVRAAYLREHILASAGLVPLPEKTALNPVVFGDIPHQDYIVSKVYFESLPGFFVTGNLYRPTGAGPFPAILSPHGHWAYGRLENSELASIPGRAINLARQGFVVFTYDMIGYNDSRQLPHTFGGDREKLWGLSLAGLQLWNSIRSLDFLQTLSYVKRDAIGVTGASGGGTQTFLVAAVDDRVSVAAPVNMISLHMQGGCLCENEPGLRLDTTNVEIASTIAPRPLLMVSATGDWTKNTMELEYPAVRRTYLLFDAPDRVHGVRVDAPHNYNRDSREAVYAWMARWLQGAPADVRRPERSFTADPLPDVLVFHNRALPSGAVTPETLTANWIASAKAQLSAANQDAAQRALRHVLGFAATTGKPVEKAGARGPRTVLLASPDSELEGLLKRERLAVSAVTFTPFDTEAAAKIHHFDSYNRSAASQRVADIVAAARAHPGAVLVAQGDAALSGILAAAVAPIELAVLDVGTFDPTNDTEFVQRLFIPGLRRAGDLQTAASLAAGRLVVHNAGERFTVAGVKAGRQKLNARDIVALIKKR